MKSTERQLSRFDGEFLKSKANRNESAEGVCFDFPNKEKIDFLLTYQCNAACDHCITNSNPYRTEWLSEDEVLGVLNAGRRVGKTYIAFTGGEPLMKLPFAMRLIRAAKSLGYFVGSDTNCYWGGTLAKAVKIANDLRAAGLDALFPSVDAYHLPYISIDKMKNVVQASEMVGLHCEINYCPGPDKVINATIVAELDLTRRGFFSDGLSLTGRDVSGLMSLFPKRAPSELLDIGSMHLGISPRGDCYANVDISYDCTEFSGTPFELGSIRRDSVADILRRETDDPLIRLLQSSSPAEVHAWLLTEDQGRLRYLQYIEGKSYYSATEYWLGLFHSDLRYPTIDALRNWQICREGGHRTE